MDWEKILQLAPLALMKPGSPQGAAILQGYLRGQERMEQQQTKGQTLARQDELARSQLANTQADNARADQALDLQYENAALNRLAAYRREDQGTLGALAKAPELELAPEATPLSAQNDLTVQRLG